MSRNTQKRRKQFFAEHPYCCFCGGTVAATTEDHFPSRTLFRHRAWPVGYHFPACIDCNKATAADEELVAMLSLMRPNKEEPANAERVSKLMRTIGKRHPGLLASMNLGPSAGQRFPLLHTLGFAMPPGRELPRAHVLSVGDPRIQNAVMNFARKLALAFHYKHFNRPLPAGGIISVRWYSNYQVDNNEIPRDLAAVTPLMPKLERANGDLSDQFFYRWGAGTSADRDLAVFLAFFHASFAILGFMSNNTDFIDSVGQPLGAAWRQFGPYDWTATKGAADAGR